MTHNKHFGLSSREAEARFEQYGPNDVVEKRGNFIKKFLAPLYSPISLMLLSAAFLSYLHGSTFDCYFILALYFVNYSIQKWQEFKADRAIQDLQDKLSFNVSTMRDGVWEFVNAKKLVPGDHIRLGLGSIIPADGTVLVAKNLSINEAVLTGESLPKEKKPGDKIYSGSFVSTGNFEADVTATGKNTSFGKTIFSIEQSSEKSILEKDILSITRLLMIISIAAVCILTVVFLLRGISFEDLLILDLSLIIAGIPVALPAVMTIILSIGASGLAKKMVVVRRLSALQDLANVNLLLTDKTGTLTKNEIKVANIISYQEGMSTDDVLELAYLATSTDTPDMIDQAIAKRFEETGKKSTSVQLLNFTPYDADRKRSTSFVERNHTNILISLGAPQVIQALDEFASKDMREQFERDINDAASKGFRTLAVAYRENSEKEDHMTMAGMLFLADPLDEHSKETMRFLRQHGVGVKMLTGDNKVIAQRIAGELDLRGNIISGEEVRTLYQDQALLQGALDTAAVFAEILPKDKYDIVTRSKTKYVVAVTGDGINDLPALKAANVGIAVAGAVSALKSMADIVLLGPGLAVIQDAILESRKIFVRLYNYSIYRISESFRLIITILILGLWYGFYPLVPLQLIVLAFLNDIPIIALAFDRVHISTKPSEIQTKKRMILSLLFGSVGVFNSIIFFFLLNNMLHLPLAVIQTMFFLKLTVSGHALVFVAHTKERWFRFLPSKEVIIATLSTQLLATVLALTGLLMPANITPSMTLFIWAWAFLWMQVSELMKDIAR